MRIQLAEPALHDSLLALPWERALSTWDQPEVTDLPDGMHRHLVRYFDDGSQLYVLKELPDELVMREYRLLRHLQSAGLPAVHAVGAVTERPDATFGEGILITRHLDFSLPYRQLLTQRRVPYLTDRLLDALVGLLTRLHLSGFWWGDCSLSNTLFRRDAGALCAYVVDVETGETHPGLSDGQRNGDLDIAVENVAGGLFDLEAAGNLPPGVDPVAVALAVRERYDRLWHELTAVETIPATETYRIEARMRRLNDLGFDIEELEIRSSQSGDTLSLVPRVVELGYHAPRLAQLTGLRCGENQARRLLNDICEYRARLEQRERSPVPESVAAIRWLSRVFEPTLRAIPSDLAAALEPAEIFHQLLEHRWFLSERSGHDVGAIEALTSYIDTVLPGTPDEASLSGPVRSDAL
jgi:hypothetical protein